MRRLPGVGKVTVNVVWDPPWSPEMMSEEMKQRFHGADEME
jgi:metal-sulfur cluster biosynthetic enzyme